MKARLFNRIWLWSQAGQYAYFQKNLHTATTVQEQILANYLKLNSDTEYGREYHFSKLKTYRDYVDFVPIVDDFSLVQPYIDKMANGQGNVLFKGKPLFFETTSGSTSNAKWIPYNAQLKREFQAAVAVWMNDVYRQCPAAFNGPSYWSLSPALKDKETTTAGIPVGISSDTDYFNALTAFFLKQLFAVPSNLGSILDAHQFYLQTWRHLLSRTDLSFVSVWSPNFLLNLDAFLRANLEEILQTSLISNNRKNEVKWLVGNGSSWQRLFTKLALVSCWTQAQAAIWLPKLKAILGDVPLQGKGLLSTEGVVTIPLGFDKHILAYTSQFYEFRLPETGKICRAHELESDAIYEVILTTGGGLYRYCTKDLVRCTGYVESVPCLEFMGRGSGVSDMIGEKISEVTVNSILAKLVAQCPINSAFLYPVQMVHSAKYLLIVESNEELEAASLTIQVENELSKNPYYKQALAIGQLAKLELLKLPIGFSDNLYLQHKKARKIKDGDVKLPLLLPLKSLESVIGC
ncbi:MAG: GH3 auxin-responsive promoter family protein [Saprospiraceae bacterium]|nr:GH3 auxin-responsive promoter family protein [Saprospiraceae bacterium]